MAALLAVSELVPAVLAGAAHRDDALAACPRPRELAAVAGHTSQVTCSDPAAGAPVRGPARVLFDLGIDPNRASASTLEALPGVGPARAAAIVAGRAAGPYRSLADLGRVPGIGPVTLRRSAAWLTFGPAAAETAGPGSLAPLPAAPGAPGEEAP